MTAEEVLTAFRRDAPYLFLGAAFAAVGMVSAAFAFLRRQRDSLLIWFAYVYLNSESGELRYSAAAHPPLLLVGNGRVTRIEENGLMLPRAILGVRGLPAAAIVSIGCDLIPRRQPRTSRHPPTVPEKIPRQRTTHSLGLHLGQTPGNLRRAAVMS